MYQVNFYKGAKRVKDKTFATRGEALAAVDVWEMQAAGNSCEIIADHNLPRKRAWKASDASLQWRRDLVEHINDRAAVEVQS